MAELLDNPSTVVWSHSNRQADFYELPTDGEAMHEALGWLLQQYKSVKLWMGVETEDGAEIYLTCSPSLHEEVVTKLTVYQDNESIFELAVESTGSLETQRVAQQ